MVGSIGSWTSGSTATISAKTDSKKLNPKTDEIRIGYTDNFMYIKVYCGDMLIAKTRFKVGSSDHGGLQEGAQQAQLLLAAGVGNVSVQYTSGGRLLGFDIGSRRREI